VDLVTSETQELLISLLSNTLVLDIRILLGRFYLVSTKVSFDSVRGLLIIEKNQSDLKKKKIS
jgi:hypothetical protein